MKRVLKRIGLVLIVLLATGIIALAIVGVPSPPVVTTENVPRVPWKWAWRLASSVQEMNATTSFRGWIPAERQMVVGVGTGGSIRLLQEPGGAFLEIEGLPEGATDLLFPRDTTQHFFVFSLDKNGNEMYRHYRYDLDTGTMTPLTQEAARSFLCCLSPQDSRLAYSTLTVDGEKYEIYVTDPRSPASEELIYQEEADFYPAAWSPDGHSLAVTHRASNTSKLLHLFVLETRTMQRLLPTWGDSVIVTAPTFGEDGKALFFASDYGSEFRHLRRLDLQTGTVTTLSQGIPWDVTDLALTPDGTRLAFLVNEDGSPAAYVFDQRAGAVGRIENTPDGYLGGFDKTLMMHPQRNEFAVTVVSASGVSSVYSYDLDAGVWTRWTQPGLDETNLPPVELIHYPTFDSVQGAPRIIPAFVFRAPTDDATPGPVLISIHGGPAEQALPTLSPMFNVMRQQGITIIAPNVRGSDGYGKTYRTLDDGRHREDAVRDIGALLDWIEEQPDLDENRVAVMGGSYGGYMTLASLIHYPDRFRCGADLFGISNFNTFLQESRRDFFVDYQRTEYGDERDPDTRAFLDSISPLNRADHIKAPLLVFQGANDIRVKPQQSLQMVERIRARGGTVHYIEAANEGHGLTNPLNLLYVGAAGMHILRECLLDQ